MKPYRIAADWLGQTSVLKAFHGWATVVWVGLVPPTLLLWRNSIPWLAFMSVWANVAGHFSSWQAARVEALQREQAGS